MPRTGAYYANVRAISPSLGCFNAFSVNKWQLMDMLRGVLAYYNDRDRDPTEKGVAVIKL